MRELNQDPEKYHDRIKYELDKKKKNLLNVKDFLQTLQRSNKLQNLIETLTCYIETCDLALIMRAKQIAFSLNDDVMDFFEKVAKKFLNKSSIKHLNYDLIYSHLL